MTTTPTEATDTTTVEKKRGPSEPTKEEGNNDHVPPSPSPPPQDGDSLAKNSSFVFVESMTFASSRHRPLDCDCDECGVTGSSVNSFVPNAIQEALSNYKRQKRFTSLRRTQERRLLQNHALALCPSTEERESSVSTTALISIWQWTLPLQAEPLLEFGNSHRLVYVQRLAAAAAIQHIGTGIIGSQAEAQGRKRLDWKQGHVYLVPSRQGKAVGWMIHEDIDTKDHDDEEERTASELPSGGPAVLYVLKVPPEALEDAPENIPHTTWYNTIRAVCQRALVAANHTSSAASNPSSYIVDATDAALIAQVCKTAEEAP
jgi:hypothetical protein